MLFFFLLVLISQFFMDTNATFNKARKLFSVNTLINGSWPSSGASQTWSENWTKAGGQRARIFVVRVIDQVRLEGMETRRGFFWVVFFVFLSRDQPRHTPSSSTEAGHERGCVCVCVCEGFKGLVKAGVGQAQWGSYYCPIGISCDLKDC